MSMMRVGCYDFIKAIGLGSFSTVYQAVNLVTNSKVAIKAILKTQDSESMFLSEIEILSQLDHPFISPIFDVIQDEQNYYIVMELSDNMSLLECINDSKRLTEETARKYFIQIVSALEYMHINRKVIHRDLKAENILIDSSHCIRLIDFGLSKHFSFDNERLKTLCGSVDYASPEILRSEEYTTQSDVWSLGVVLYAMVHGSMPFSGVNVPEMISHIINNEPKYSPQLSSTLLDLLKRILTKDPNERITISDIKKHPWLFQKRIKVEEEFMFLNSAELKIVTDELDPAIEKELQGLNLDLHNLLAKIKKNEFDEVTAAYKILKKQKINEIINQQMPKFERLVASPTRPPTGGIKSGLPVLDNKLLPASPRPVSQMRRRLCKRDFCSLNFGIENMPQIANDNTSSAKTFLKSPKIRRRLIHPNSNSNSNNLFGTFSPL